MIQIIKEGKLENYKFKTTCPVCGCEFEYELCDLHKKYDFGRCLTSYPPQYMYKRYVTCPCCGENIFHDSGSDFGDTPQIIYTNTSQSLSDCDTCPNKPNPDKVVFGDTPCTFCEKMTPKCN